jgi:predicted transcriptional regulator
MADPFEHVAFLARSRNRVRLLSRLSDAGPMTRRDLRDQLDASQSTVARAVQALAERGWVESDGGTVRLTSTGKFVGDAFGDLLASLEAADDLGPFLRWFPREEFDLTLTHFRGASVTTVRAGDPYAPARVQTEFVQTADRLRTLLPSIDLEWARVVHERVTSGELEGEVVVGPRVGEAIRDGEYARLFREKLQTGRLSVYCHAEPIPVYLGLDEGTCTQIGVEDDDGMPQALLETHREAVRTWAEDVYRAYRDRATELGPADFS